MKVYRLYGKRVDQFSWTHTDLGLYSSRKKAEEKIQELDKNQQKQKYISFDNYEIVEVDVK